MNMMHLFSNNVPEGKVLEHLHFFSPNIQHLLYKQTNETATSITETSPSSKQNKTKQTIEINSQVIYTLELLCKTFKWP